MLWQIKNTATARYHGTGIQDGTGMETFVMPTAHVVRLEAARCWKDQILLAIIMTNRQFITFSVA